MKRFEFRLGRTLQPGEESSTGLYALMSNTSGIALRISMMKEIAELHSCDSSRSLREASLVL